MIIKNENYIIGVSVGHPLSLDIKVYFLFPSCVIFLFKVFFLSSKELYFARASRHTHTGVRVSSARQGFFVFVIFVNPFTSRESVPKSVSCDYDP